MSNKKFLSIILIFAIVISSAAMVFAADFTLLTTIAAPEESNDIVIIATNDTHCKNYENFAKVATLAKDADLLLDAGDHVQGGPFGSVSSGEYVIEVMNAVGYDIATLGNHEFDFGMSQLEKLTSMANATYVCCNYLNVGSDVPIYDAYTIEEIGGKKIAILGIATPNTLVESAPTNFQDANGVVVKNFCQGDNGKELYKQVQKYVDKARAEGADYVIALGHLGNIEESKPWRVDDVLANVTGIDAFIDAHSHTKYSEEKNGVPAVQSGTELANVSKVTIKEDGRIVTEVVSLEGVEEDAAVKAVIDEIKAEYETVVGKVVATSSVDLTTKKDGKRAIRSEETNLGDFCADAYKTMLGADLAIINGGGIRSDIAAGDVKMEDILAVHPFSNSICLVGVSGQQILDALELGAMKAPSENGGFLQVSGISYSIDLNVKSFVVLDDAGAFVKVDGERRVKDVKIGGVDIDPAKEYKLAAHNYMVKKGGDGFSMFGVENVTMLKNEAMVDSEVLVKYVTEVLDGKIGDEYAKAAGRINLIPVEEKAEEGAEAEEAKIYTVLKGDCLWNIAKKLYGTGLKWKLLYEANKGLIGSNPNLIFAGQTLQW